MQDLTKIFDQETVQNISNLIETKMDKLNNVPEFHDKDQLFAMKLDELENSLSGDLQEKLNDLMRLNYQLEDYYLTLSYFIGYKHHIDSENL